MTVAGWFSSEQLLLFVFARCYIWIIVDMGAEEYSQISGILYAKLP